MMPYSISPPALRAASLCIGVILKHTRAEVGSMRPGHSRLIGVQKRTCPLPRLWPMSQGWLAGHIPEPMPRARKNWVWAWLDLEEWVWSAPPAHDI